MKIDGAGGNFGDVQAFGQGLGNDHPIGLPYATGNGTLFDSELEGVATASTVNWANGDTAGTIADILFDNKVECASCHDVHNTKSNGADALLVVNNDSSDLCLTCHNK
jgi:predicted CXXCH cytochrome family protein